MAEWSVQSLIDQLRCKHPRLLIEVNMFSADRKHGATLPNGLFAKGQE